MRFPKLKSSALEPVRRRPRVRWHPDARFRQPPQTADGPIDFGKRNPSPASAAVAYAEQRKVLQATMSRTFGIVRSRDQMEQGLIEVEALQHTLDATTPAGVRELMLHIQMANSLLVARACLRAGFMREESRGAHLRGRTSRRRTMRSGNARCGSTSSTVSCSDGGASLKQFAETGVRAAESAVLVVDVQNDFVDDRGRVGILAQTCIPCSMRRLRSTG